MAAEKKRGIQMARDMVISMGVVTLAAGVIYLFVPHGDEEEPVVRTVDYEVELTTASRAAPYPVEAPRGLSDRWRPTSVRYEGAGSDGAAWHLGFVAPSNEYAAVEQSDSDPRRFVAGVTHDAERTGDRVRVDGEAWERYEGQKYDALVRVEDEVTTVVTGTAPFAQLKQLAASLEPRGEQDAEG